MSLREKAREIKAEGESERGNFTPTGAPKKAYKYWLGETNSKKGKAVRNGERKENFCHFWRVVVFWAPIMFVRNKGAAFFTNPIVAVTLALGLLATFIFFCFAVGEFGQIVLAIIGILVGLVACVAGGMGAASLLLTKEERRIHDLPEKKWAIPMVIIGLPGALIVSLFLGTVLFYEKFLERLFRKYQIFIALTVFGALVIALLGLIFAKNGLWGGLAVVGIILGVIVGAGMLLIGGMFAADFISGLRVKRNRAERLARDAYFEEHGDLPEGPVLKPGLFKRILSGMGDFIIFFAQIVRVKKWKICPIVEVDNDN